MSAHAKFGRVDIVANNAGYSTIGEVEAVADDVARALFETNFWGAANVAREAVRVFRELNPAGAGGKLLNFSSISGIQGMAGFAHYCSSKFGEWPLVSLRGPELIRAEWRVSQRSRDSARLSRASSTPHGTSR